MPIVQQIEFEPSLASRFPDETVGLYKTCQTNADKHTGGHPFFDLRPTTEGDDYQDIDCQYVPSNGSPVSVAVAIGAALSKGLEEIPTRLADEYGDTLDEVQDATSRGYNIVVASTTHKEVHDIAFPFGLVRAALAEHNDVDEPDKWIQIFSKALAWYQMGDTPVPEVAESLSSVLYTLPHSLSGNVFNAKLKKEYNTRAMKQLWHRLDQGGHYLGFATSGSTNINLPFDGRELLTFQGPIHSSTAKLMTNRKNLVLPVACYFDPDTSLKVKLGELCDPRRKSKCMDIGIWGAEQYSEMSGGVHAFQVRSAQQLQKIVEDSRDDIVDGIRNLKNKKVIQWLIERYHTDETNIDQEPEE